MHQNTNTSNSWDKNCKYSEVIVSFTSSACLPTISFHLFVSAFLFCFRTFWIAPKISAAKLTCRWAKLFHLCTLTISSSLPAVFCRFAILTYWKTKDTKEITLLYSESSLLESFVSIIIKIYHCMGWYCTLGSLRLFQYNHCHHQLVKDCYSLELASVFHFRMFGCKESTSSKIPIDRLLTKNAIIWNSS